MKKILFVLFSLVFTMNSMAQELVEGSLSFLQFKESVIEVNWDFSNTVFDGEYDLNTWISKVTTQEEWENKIKPSLMEKFLDKINNETNEKNIYFVDDAEAAEYVMTIAPVTLTSKGNNETVYTIVKKDTNEVKAKFNLKEKGGVIGSLNNLLGDGYKGAGKDLGKYFKKNVKQKVKKTKHINWGFGITTSKTKEEVK